MTLQREHLAPSALCSYALAALPTGFSFVLVSIYLLKFSTDVLGISPAAMAALLFASRLWDALLDPLAGLLSDRTRSRWGRRRPWLVAGALPMAAGFAALFSAPAALDAPALALWTGAALFAFFTGVTLVELPHSALGAELSDAYHERTRIFGWKRALFGAGALAAVGALGWIEGAAEPRGVGRAVAWIGAALVLAGVPLTALLVRERPDYQGRGGIGTVRVFRDVLRNPHARVLLLVFTLQQVGITAISVSLPYLSEYVLGTPERTGQYIFTLFFASLLGVPIWVRSAGRLDKRRALQASMAAVLLAIGALFLAGQGDVVLVLVLAALGGVASAGMDVLGPSLQADVVDWDELRTGERKEGAYFALWSFAQKTATACASLVTAAGLAWVGFVPNAPQTDTAVLGIRVLSALLPACFFGVGLLLFGSFGLSAAEHARIRVAIEGRSGAVSRP
jgi:GPH family glycoside/pentoside/hexuronide:cation symporter